MHFITYLHTKLYTLSSSAIKGNTKYIFHVAAMLFSTLQKVYLNKCLVDFEDPLPHNISGHCDSGSVPDCKRIMLRKCQVEMLLK